jgi:hypothetical protein
LSVPLVMIAPMKWAMVRLPRQGSPWLRDFLFTLPVYGLAATVMRGGLATSEHPGDVGHYSSFAHMVVTGQVPYRDFFMEYPPAALGPFLVPEIWPAHYLALFKVTMFLCGVGVLVLVARISLGDSVRRRSLLAVAVSPLLIGPVFLTRYDLWPALLATAALAAMLRERWRLAGVLLALTFGAKLFAIALIPLVAIHIWRRAGRQPLIRAAVAFAITTVLVWGPFLIVGAGGVRFSLKSQLERGLQIESLGAAVLLALDKLGLYDTHWVRGLSIELGGSVPRVVGALTTAVEGAVIAVIAFWYATTRQGTRTLIAAYAASVTAFVSFGKVLSPQFLIWLIPLVPLVAGRRGRTITAIFLACLLATQLEVNYGDWGLRNVNWSVWLLAVRHVLLLTVLLLLIRAARADMSSADSKKDVAHVALVDMAERAISGSPGPRVAS